MLVRKHYLISIFNNQILEPGVYPINWICKESDIKVELKYNLINHETCKYV